MSYLVLARKYRPQTFEEVIGQDHVSRTLTNAISADRVAHAILFSGPRGTGKTTVARILAKALNCEKGPAPVPCNTCRSCQEITSTNAADVFEIDGASNNSVDQIRELRENVKYMPAHSPYKIYIIDEVHMLSMAAFNALLKTLEEPPAHILFFFATTEPHKIPVTILSRCQRHDFRRIEVKSIVAQMQKLCGKENFTVSEESLWLIAREAQGGMRDALSLLDQVMACSGESVTHEQLLETLGIIDRKFMHDLSDAILGREIAELLDIVDQIYDRGHDMKKLHADLVEHFRNMLVVKIGQNSAQLVDLPAVEIETIRKQIKGVSQSDLSQVLDFIFKEEAAIKFATRPKLAFEMLFVKMFQSRPALPIDVLIQKLDRLRKEFQGAGLERDADDGPDSNRSKKKTVPSAEREIESGNRTTAFETMDDLESTWEKCLEVIGEENPVLAANLTRSTLSRTGAKNLEIAVSGNGFNHNMIKRPKHMKTLERVCREYFGQNVELNLKTKDGAAQNRRKKKQNTNQMVQEALNDPLVAKVVEIFNGQVVDVKIL